MLSDMDRALPFYRDLLGMEVWADFRDDSAYVQAVSPEGGAKVAYCRDPKSVLVGFVQFF